MRRHLMNMTSAGLQLLANMPAPIVFPALAEHKSTVIIAHGLGDSGEGYVPIVQNWHQAGLFPTTKFILPSAPAIPVTSAAGRSIPAWFDIRGDRGPHVTFAHLAAQPQDEAGIVRSRDWFAELIRSERKAVSNSDPDGKVLMGGFSQGAVMSLFTALTTDLLDGVFVMSGYLPLANEVLGGGGGGGEGGKERTMPIAMFHGDADRVINLEWAEESAKAVKGMGYEVDLTVVRGLGHGINPQVLSGVTDFIQRVQNSPQTESQHDEL